MDNNAIESIVQAVLKKLSESGESAEVKKADVFAAVTSFADDIPDSDLVDITSKEIKSVPLIENPADGDSLERMIKSTPARCLLMNKRSIRFITPSLFTSDVIALITTL